MKRILIIYFLLALSKPIFSQTHYGNKFTDKLYFKNYTAKDGLPSNEVYQVIQDSKGYMWFATDFGVSRFDGYKFTNFTSQEGLPDNTVFEVYEDYKGRIWFVSRSAKLSYFYNDSIYEYWNNDVFLKSIDVVKNILNKTFSVDEQDNVYLGITYQGIFKITNDGKVTRKYQYNPPLNATVIFVNNNTVEVDVNCNLIKNSLYLEILKNNKKFRIKRVIDSKLVVSSSNTFTAIGRNEEIYYSVNSILYCIKDSSNYKYRIFKNDNIIYLFIDIESRLWIGTQFSGFYCFKDGDITKEPCFHILPDKAGSGILCDKEGGYWVTTIYNGVYYIPSLKIKTYTSADGLAFDAVNNVVSDGESIIASKLLSSYLNIIENEKIKKINLFNDPNKSISSIYYDNKEKTLWIGTRTNIYKYKNGNLKIIDRVYQTTDSSNIRFLSETFEIIKGSDGNIWAATNQGILKIQNDKAYLYGFNGTLPRVYCLFEDKINNLWFGSNDGLYKLNNGKITYWGNKNPLLKLRITSIKKCSESNCLWLATKGAGILLMDGEKISHIQQNDGLLSNHIKHLFVDNDVIWASSIKGLNKITVSKEKGFSFKIENYIQSDGLISSEINSVNVKDNMVYVATNGGLCVFNKSIIETNKYPPPVYITNIKIMDNDTGIIKKYSLPYNKNFIEINFVGLSFRTAGDITYKYRLLGANSEWSFTKNTKILYPLLPDGEYKFEVYAINKAGVLSKTPATVEFIINPPFWRRWWFTSLSILFLAALILLFFYTRLHAVKKTNALRMELNKYMQQALSQQMNPHFIFNSLTSIQNYILKNDKDTSNWYLAKFSRLMRLVLNNSQNQQITIQQELDALSIYIELESLRFKEKFEYSISVDEKLDTTMFKMPPLLLQPYVENAICHGLMHKEEGVGKINVDLQLKENLILCTITDNGIGREKAAEIKNKKTQTFKSYGTNITGKRLKLISTLNNLRLQINFIDLKDNTGKAIGTKIEIPIPLIK